jgi:hypothetical protein
MDITTFENVLSLEVNVSKIRIIFTVQASKAKTILAAKTGQVYAAKQRLLVCILK